MIGRRDIRLRALAFTVAVISVLGFAVRFTMPPHVGRSAPVPATSASAAFSAGAITPARQALKRELAERFQQAVMMLHARRYDYAVTALHRVLELSSRMPEAHVNMGFALLGLERYAAARDFFETAIKLRAGQVNAYYGLAMALEGLCDLPGATGAMRSYIHLAARNDPFVRRAQAALWEWGSATDAQAVSAIDTGRPADKKVCAAANPAAAPVSGSTARTSGP